MGHITVEGENKPIVALPDGLAEASSIDQKWQTINRIIETEPFRKSTRLPTLLRYLAQQTIEGRRQSLTEQAIGQAVFAKGHHYSPTEDSAVRVHVRQLRLRLLEYYASPPANENIVVSIPKGGYALSFVPTPAKQQPILVQVEQSPALNQKVFRTRAGVHFGYSLGLLFLLVLAAVGWFRALEPTQPTVPWPIGAVVHKGTPTNVVIADAGYALRMLGDQEISLDHYINHSYLQPILPKDMSENEAFTFRYLDSSRLTSDADAQATAMLASLAGPYANNLLIRSARDVNANELTHGDFIFVGSKTSNPWVELMDSKMNFQIVEDGLHGARYIVNRKPKLGEQPTYRTTQMQTLSSGDDYAVIALLPSQSAGRSSLLLEGVRMEGTKAAIAFLQDADSRTRLQRMLADENGGRTPRYFEAVLHAKSVAGATMSVEIVATRSVQ